MIKKILESLQRKQAMAQLREPVRPDWSAWAREPGKKTRFREALLSEVLHIGFVTENNKLNPEIYKDAEAFASYLESSIKEVSEAQTFLPYTYEGPDEKPVFPLFSASCMMQEFIQKSDFMKAGYMGLNAVGQEPPEGLMVAARYFSQGFSVILNPYTKWAYGIEPEDFLWALERVKQQAQTTSPTIE